MPFPRRRRGLPLQLLGAALLAILLWGVARMPDAERAGLFAALARLPLWLPSLYAVLLLTFSLRYWRWRLLLGGYGIGGWSRVDAIAWFRGFALTATPGKLGELVRVHELHEWLGYPRTPLLQVFVLERGCDVLAVVVWLTLLAPAVIVTSMARLDPRPLIGNAPGAALLPWLVAAVGGALLLVLALRAPGPRLWRHLMGVLPRRRGPLLRASLAAAGVSLLVWACEPLILWILVRALSSRALPLTLTTAIYLLSGTAGMASTLPAGIGVNEAATVLLLGQQGIPAAIALPIAIIRRLLTPWSIVALASTIAPPVASSVAPGAPHAPAEAGSAPDDSVLTPP